MTAIKSYDDFKTTFDNADTYNRRFDGDKSPLTVLTEFKAEHPATYERYKKRMTAEQEGRYYREDAPEYDANKVWHNTFLNLPI